MRYWGGRPCVESRLIRFLGAAEKPMTVSEIAKEIDASVNMVRTYLIGMEATGRARHFNTRPKLWSITPLGRELWDLARELA